MKYAVTLKSCGNIDIGQNPFETISPTHIYTADSIEECQQVVRNYIERWNLGGSNWTGGDVYDGLGNLIGNISYNGRFWLKEVK